MIIGTTLMRLGANPQYSPQFARGGLGATFVCEILDLDGSGIGFGLNIDIEHKNIEDTSFAKLGDFGIISSVAVHKVSLVGIKEQVRFKYSVGGTAATNAVHFNMYAPSWRPY